ncbi:MAG: lyase family protein [Pseudomonadota bacterium]
MFDDYLSDAEIATLVAPERVLAAMIQVEKALASVQAKQGIISQSAADEIVASEPGIKVAALAAGTARDGVPIPAFLALWRKGLSREAADALHFGATSQDILDTAHILCWREAISVLRQRLSAVLDALTEQADRGAGLVMAGRTRAQIASPITYGLRAARWAQPLIALEAQAPLVLDELARVQLGGAVGANLVLAPAGDAVTAALAKALDLRTSLPWHTDRTGINGAAQWAGQISQVLAKIAGDVLLLTRSEIAELRLSGGGGSSAMPHKQNPVTPEAIVALHRLGQGALTTLMGAPHLEERDGAAWAVEWRAVPQVLIATGAALQHAADMLARLEPDGARMAAILSEHPGVWAELAALDLSASRPKSEAVAVVKQCLAAEMPLMDALAQAAPDIDWPARLSPERIIAPCRDLAAAIIRERG